MVLDLLEENGMNHVLQGLVSLDPCCEVQLLPYAESPSDIFHESAEVRGQLDDFGAETPVGFSHPRYRRDNACRGQRSLNSLKRVVCQAKLFLEVTLRL